MREHEFTIDLPHAPARLWALLTDEARVKRDALADWVAAVNDYGGFGRWASDVSVTTADVAGILERHGAI